MVQKLTYDFVKNEINKTEEYVLITDTYINNAIKMQILHRACGRIFNMCYNNFRKGNPCPLCSRDKFRLSYDFAKSEIEKEPGYVLLSKEYKNNDEKLEIQCHNKHIFYMGLKTFRAGHRCAECVGLKKREYDYVKTYIENKKFILVSTEYINSKTKLDLICPKGHKIRKTFRNIQENHNCETCYKELKYSKEDVKNILTLSGYAWISGEYEKTSSELVLECKEKHIFKSSFIRFMEILNRNKKYNKNNSACDICNKRCISMRNRKQSKHLTFDEVKQFVESKNYTLLSTEYNKSSDKLNLTCPNGHKIKMSLSNLKKYNCMQCCSKKRHEYDFVKSEVEAEGYTLISPEYKNNIIKLQMLCPQKHKTEISYHDFHAGNKCGICQIFYSELKVGKFLNIFTNYEWKKHRPDWLKYKSGRNLEIDFWCEELNVGIEVQGKQHYVFTEAFYNNKEKFDERQKKDQFKRDKFKENNKTLIEVRALDYHKKDRAMYEELVTLLEKHNIAVDVSWKEKYK